MAKWLFNSKGHHVAFVSGNNVFEKNSRFLGELDGEEIWNSTYVGEIIEDDRLARKTLPPASLRGMPGLPGSPGLPGLPGLRGAVLYPAGYEDVDIA